MVETEQTLRRRIATVADLHAIVRTLKALSAVSARQYENALKSLDDYEQTIDLGLQIALRKQSLSKIGRRQSPEKIAGIVFGSDVGLCGRFNEDLAQSAVKHLQSLSATTNQCRLLAIGSRIQASLQELGLAVETVLMTPSSKAGIDVAIRQILSKIEQWQDQGLGQIWLYYSQSGIPCQRRLLPVEQRQFELLKQKPWPGRSLPTFTLESEQLLAALLRQYLFVSLFRACSESLASEHLMRLRTTQAAEKNILERHDQLSAEFRTRRQDAIDAELLDIGAGFEAVGGGK